MNQDNPAMNNNEQTPRRRRAQPQTDVPPTFNPYSAPNGYEQSFQQDAPQQQASGNPPQGDMNSQGTPADASAESYFDGKLSQQIGYAILGALVTIFTLGICYPWAFCMQYRWQAKHTVINGRRLAFDGTAAQLFGQWILWFLLCIITLGIYSFWVGIALEKWRVKHTHFAN